MKNRKPSHGQDAWLINQAKEIAILKKRLSKSVQEIYACFCKVLYEEYGWTYEQITAIFARTQEQWNELVDTPDMESMVKWCDEVTDILIAEGEDE